MPGSEREGNTRMKTFVFVVFLAAVVGGILRWGRPWQARGPLASADGSAHAAPPALEATRAVEFPEGAQWLQSKPLKLADLHDQVVIVHFWTFGCINCIHNYPVYKAWQEKYTGKGVTIIGVHTPEFAREADVARVRTKARDNGLMFPIVIDNDSTIWKSWDNNYWPSIYLIDKIGRVRYHWDGELHLNTTAGRRFASRIDELLAEKP
jgi:thiol-disulfide isomerase/thioredoxin